MITLFRRIRKNLISENRVSRYLLYALGEILLVVIGILIALSVNNWKENRQQNAQQKIYLNLILEDLRLQKEENQVQRTAQQRFAGTGDALRGLMARNFELTEEEKTRVKTMLNSLVISRTYGSYEATFADLTSSGNLSVISNKGLKNSIVQHYQVQRRDRDVINNNQRKYVADLWNMMVDRNALLLSEEFSKLIMADTVIAFDPRIEFLDEVYFENLTEPNNMILLQNVLAIKEAAKEVGLLFLEQSDVRIDELSQAIEAELKVL